FPSSQSASPPSSTRASQSLSTPSQISGPDVSTWTLVESFTGGALVANAVAVFAKSGSRQCGSAFAAIWTVRGERGGSALAVTSSGLVDTTVHPTPGSSADTVTVAPDM